MRKVIDLRPRQNWFRPHAVLLALLAVAGCAQEPGRDPGIRGVTLDARRPVGTAELDGLAALGASHVAVVPMGFQTGPDASEIRFRGDGRWYSESDAGIAALADSLRARGLRIVLKPHVWLRGGLPSDIDFDHDADWSTWEASYRAFALYYAALARDVDADLFVIGTELQRSAIQRPDFWRGLAAEVRGVFPGRITYAANWWGEADSLVFWDALDAIGVQAYYPLSDDDSPDGAALSRGWDAPIRKLRAHSRRWNRPVVFTEIGYRSVSSAGREPWTWVRRGAEETPDPELQARLYASLFERPWREPWLDGVFVWKWHAGDSPDAERRRAHDFTPQGKPAEDIIRNGFSGRAPTSGSRPLPGGP